MAHPERVVRAFAAAGESADPSQRPHPAEFIPSAGQQFMRVGLMPHVPDNLVGRHIKNILQGYREFHDAQAGRQMASV